MEKNEKVEKIREMKGKEKLVMLTSYDFITATYLKEVGIEIILVGDSVGNVLLGYKNTQPVTMEEMLHHTKAVARASPQALIVGDMPFGSYESPKKALESAKRFIGAGAQAVKLEGAKTPEIKLLKENGIEVMGHVGLTPQTITEWKVQGRDEEQAKKILQEAVELDKAGCFSIVVESVPIELGKKITANVSVPTIGIGAGPFCDGQVLVINDLLGLNADDFKPRFVKQYLNLRPQIIEALKQFKKEVKEKKFPAEENSYN